MISPQVIGGLVSILAGTLLIVFRNPLANANRDAQRATFGRLAKYSSQNSTPGNAMFVGILAIVLGAGLVLFAPAEPTPTAPSDGDATLVRAAAILLGLVELAFGTLVLARLPAIMRRVERRYASLRSPDGDHEEERTAEGAEATPPRRGLVAGIAIIGLGMGVATVVIGLRL